jgi:SAM-dependent methyltransferase
VPEFSHVYDAGYFDCLEVGARRSARSVLGLLRAVVRPTSVLDVGCVRGVWLAQWMSEGVSDVCGIDGSYVEATGLAIPREHFIPTDLSQPFALGRRFDLVQSLEVAEHLPESSAESFVESLTQHGDLILFSAAVPGQGGKHHVNEQSPEYWRAKFSRRGYAAYDALRPLLRNRSEVEPWYRYNLLLYASEQGGARLSAGARARRVPQQERIPDVAPTWWRVRNRMLRGLPRPAIDALANWKHRVVRTTRTYLERGRRSRSHDDSARLT